MGQGQDLIPLKLQTNAIKDVCQAHNAPSEAHFN